jgi:hypothetical protein
MQRTSVEMIVEAVSKLEVPPRSTMDLHQPRSLESTF